MEEIQTVCRYLDHLKQRYGLFLSLHPLRPETLIGQSELLRYNMHENPYCIFLKSCAGVWNHCVERQEKLLPGLAKRSVLRRVFCRCARVYLSHSQGERDHWFY